MAPSVGSRNGKGQEKISVPSDALLLPLPPVSLDFAIRGDANGEAFLQRYVRKGDSEDASLAIVGKGGFGTAYKFVRDNSFTPPCSMLDSNPSTDYRQGESMEEEKIEALKSTSKQEEIKEAGDSNRSFTDNTSKDGRDNRIGSSSGYSQNVSQSKVSSSPNVRSTSLRNKAPPVIVVKVCRTPTSGSYDELPKTGRGREEAKAAAQELALGNPWGLHTRIVRGEARLLRYLQMAQAMEKKKGQQSYVVRLLADMETPVSRQEGCESEVVGRGGPPMPRLLIFERLVDLDAELTPQGWVRSRRLWTVEKVEAVSRDVIAGLKFLHEHHVVHGDLKPSNFMRDPKTGHVKLIDLGASRRWVRLLNVDKEKTSAVEELDQSVKERHVEIPKAGDILCEGLGSLTGSPHFMAPEILLQAGRYLSEEGHARSILDDYMIEPEHLPNVPSAALLEVAYREFKRGWGVKADIWSWACSTMSLLLRIFPGNERPSSSSICAFDFCFDDLEDALETRYPLHASNDSLPRFHQWARMYPLRIMKVLEQGVDLPECVTLFSAPMLQMLEATFQVQDLRPTARIVLKVLEADTIYGNDVDTQVASSSSEFSSITAHSVDLHPTTSLGRLSGSATTSAFSHTDEAYNIDLSNSNAMSAYQSIGQEGVSRIYPLHQSFVILDSPPPKRIDIKGNALSPSSALSPHQRYLQNRLIHSPISSPGLHSAGISSGMPSKRLAPQTFRSAAVAMDVSPGPNTITMPSPVHQSSGSMQMAGSATSTVQRRTTRTSALLDEVFMQEYQREEKQMPPAPPFPPTAIVRQMDSVPMVILPAENLQVSNAKGYMASSFKALPPSPGSDYREEAARKVKQKLSFPTLRPRRDSIVGRIASHLSPSRPSNPPPPSCSLADNHDYSSEDEMLIDEVEEYPQIEQSPAPSSNGLYSSDPFGPPSLMTTTVHHRSSSLGSDSRYLQSPPTSSPIPLPSSSDKLRSMSPFSTGSSNRMEGMQTRSRKSSSNVFGLGIDLNRSLRSVRSFTMSRGHGHHTTSSGMTPSDGEEVLCSIADNSQQEFLHHDPYALDTKYSPDSTTTPTTANAITSSNHHPYPPSQTQQRRNRSWSFLFKRKKV